MYLYYFCAVLKHVIEHIGPYEICKELRSIIDFNKEGKWLVLLENQIGTELPWALIKQSAPRDIIFLEG